MTVSLAPVPLHWNGPRMRGFYSDVATWPLSCVYLGETVCSKRRELTTRDWIVIAFQLREAGIGVVLSTLTLIEARSEAAALRRLCENREFMVEANDYAAVYALEKRRVPWVGGATLNVYNGTTLRWLCARGMVRWQPPVDMPLPSLERMHAEWEGHWPETEVLAWGRRPLAWSARCYTARAHNRQKDDCGFICSEHPDGLTVSTRDGTSFLNINGTQTRAHDVVDVSDDIEALRTCGASLLRVIPAVEGTAAAVMQLARAAAKTPSRSAGATPAPCLP